MAKVNQTLIDLIFEEPVEDFVVLDVGCGRGALSFVVAERAKRVIGIDISSKAIAEARSHARENTTFHVMDADFTEYRSLGDIDMVVSHLCMSDEMIKNSFKALPWCGSFAFACFHADHLIEGGRRSRFSYTEEEMETILVKTGFRVEYLGVEASKMQFQSSVEALELLGKKTVKRWEQDGRLKAFLNYLNTGGRHLTKSILVGKARKTKK